MELDQPLRFGSLCPRCDVGMMKIERRTPDWRNPGKSRVVYQCSECEHEVAQTRDDRFA